LDDRASASGRVDTGLPERNSLANRAREDFATGPQNDPIVHGGDLPATDYALRDVLRNDANQFDRGHALVQLITAASGTTYTQLVTASNLVMAAHEQMNEPALAGGARITAFALLARW
jgi:hypothetical protein